jgi:putative transposase
MRKVDFANGEIYHVYNRGVDKRDVFIANSDYYRFIHGLYEFNDEQRTLNARHHYRSQTGRYGASSIPLFKINRIPLVEILVFNLMPNHYHLMLRQIKDAGITKFMQKLGTGYTMYFNKKNTRSGVLFQGKFKAVHVNNESQFIHLPHYIHTNPLELNYRGPTSVDYLLEYRWSSFPDYVGRSNFPSVTNRDFLLDVFGGESAYLNYTREHIVIDTPTSSTEVGPR